MQKQALDHMTTCHNWMSYICSLCSSSPSGPSGTSLCQDLSSMFFGLLELGTHCVVLSQASPPMVDGSCHRTCRSRLRLWPRRLRSSTTAASLLPTRSTGCGGGGCVLGAWSNSNLHVIIFQHRCAMTLKLRLHGSHCLLVWLVGALHVCTQNRASILRGPGKGCMDQKSRNNSETSDWYHYLPKDRPPGCPRTQKPFSWREASRKGTTPDVEKRCSMKGRTICQLSLQLQLHATQKHIHTSLPSPLSSCHSQKAVPSARDLRTCPRSPASTFAGPLSPTILNCGSHRLMVGYVTYYSGLRLKVRNKYILILMTIFIALEQSFGKPRPENSKSAQGCTAQRRNKYDQQTDTRTPQLSNN